MITITYEDVDYSYPGSLSELTLQQFIDYHVAVGVPMAARRVELATILEPDLKALHHNMIFLDEAVRTLAYFTGIPVEDVQNNIELTQVLTLYQGSGLLMLFEENTLVLEPTYDFDGDTWNIRTPLQSISDEMTHAEFSATMDLARILLDYVERKDWSLFKKLCGAYFRKVGEAFDTDFITDGSARMVLLETLPMDIALAVGYFLKDSLDLFVQTLTTYAEEVLPA